MDGLFGAFVAFAAQVSCFWAGYAYRNYKYQKVANQIKQIDWSEVKSIDYGNGIVFERVAGIDKETIEVSDGL